MRSIRRHHIDRMKARAARLWLRWQGRRRVSHTQEYMRRSIGTMAAMHCTHICGMCKHEKKMGVPHVKSHESARVFSLDEGLL